MRRKGMHIKRNRFTGTKGLHRHARTKYAKRHQRMTKLAFRGKNRFV